MSKKFFVGIVAAFAALAVASSADAAYMHSTTLKMGVTSSQVMELQKALNMTSCKVAASGAGSVGMESMYFGAKTKAAVQCFQTANGLTADGVVGAMTGAKLAAVGGTSSGSNLPAGCTSTSGFSPVSGVRCDSGSTSGSGTVSTGSLTGGAGSVKAYKLVSAYNNEEVGENEDNAKVAGLEIEADKNSDLQITAVKVAFAKGNATSRFEKFADSVTVWFDGKKVAEENADEFDSSNSYTKTLSLASGAIVKAGAKGELIVAVSGINNLDSTDVGKTWTVDFTSVRFVDAQGAVISEDPQTDARTFSFESFASATDAELKISLNDDDEDVNEAHIIDVDDSSSTDNVSLLSAEFEAKGDSDLWIDEIPVLVTVTGATNVSDFISSADLYVGSTKVGSETISGTGTTKLVTFDDLDWTLDAGDKENVYVKVNINKLDSGTLLDEGDTIKVEIDTAQRNAMVVEDEAGEDLANGDKTGSALGEASAIYDNGIMVSFVSASRSVTTGSAGNDDIGTFDVKFKVTAFGDSDVYIPDISSDTGTDAVNFDVEKSGSLQSGAGLAGTVTSNANTSGGNFKVASGTSRDFTLTVSVTDGVGGLTAGQYRALLANVRWNTTGSTSTFNDYTFNLEDYKTDYIALN